MTEKLDYWQRVSRNEVPLSPIAESADLKVMTVLPGHATVQLHVNRHKPGVCGEETRFQLNTAIDLAMTIALESSLEKDDTWAATEISIHLLKSIPEGKLYAVGEVTAIRDMTTTVECIVKDDQDQLIAKATSVHSAYTEL
ncbi:MAG: PaaI family thioesterase [Planctomycetes bacterium]|nr:PaaI family thioesterase [Planctomycetota bacterium]